MNNLQSHLVQVDLEFLSQVQILRFKWHMMLFKHMCLKFIQHFFHRSVDGRLFRKREITMPH